ncbi:BMP family ABC transporter substrate-binding protein [Schnuerera sp. xch1]|nr:BMP family ABC transporter substrate-binding protein [Schnuerera sp. xch1]
MKKRLLALLLIGTLVFTLAGCTGTDQEPTDGEPADEETADNETSSGEALKIGMVTDEGGVHDQSFNQSAWEGLELAEEELGIDPSYVESQQDGDFAPNLETLLEADNDLIWGVGFKLADAIKDAATNNPDQKYAIVDHSFGDETPDNVVNVMFKAEQPSFLVGYIAGHMTESNNVGFVGGVAGDIIWGFDYGFHAGVQVDKLQ